jgi:hypothetical protein
MKTTPMRKFREPAPGEPGSIEQQLDMNETRGLRGDEVLHLHGIERPHTAEMDEEEFELNYRVDMSEDNREGTEMAGDEHSSGMQGTDTFEITPSPKELSQEE